MSQISTRSPGLFDKNQGHMMTGSGRPVQVQVEQPELFVRRKDTKIEPVDRQSETGSLFNPEDERNFLFASGGPVAVGRYVTIKVNSNRLEKKEEAANNQGGLTNQAQTNGDDEASALEKELLAALPDLEPADKSEARLIRRFQMKVVHRFENGDALAMLTRRSTHGQLGNEITVQARIPYSRLVAGEDLTTDDLSEVQFVESSEGEIIERRSSGWEDEYTLRLSGFDEAKSRLAMELEDKRRQLQEVRQNLENQIKSLASERRKLSAEREELSKKGEEYRRETQTLNEKIKEQQELIDEQAEELAKLNPDDKPGDKKDGSDGK